MAAPPPKPKPIPRPSAPVVAPLAQATPPPAKKKAVNLKLDFPTWENETVQNVLKVTLKVSFSVAYKPNGARIMRDILISMICTTERSRGEDIV